MCFFPKGIIKLIITIVGFAIIVGSVGLMWAGQNFLNNDAVAPFIKDTKGLPYVFIYGVGVALILVGILQLYACKTENRCYIFLVYQAFIK